MGIYRKLERQFPDYIIIQKEGCFYSTHHKSAQALAQIMDYKLGIDFTGNYITGGPDSAKICAQLELDDYSFLLVECGRVIYGNSGKNPFEHNVIV